MGSGSTTPNLIKNNVSNHLTIDTVTLKRNFTVEQVNANSFLNLFDIEIVIIDATDTVERKYIINKRFHIKIHGLGSLSLTKQHM